MQRVLNSGSMTVRPLLPNQSGIQPAWPMTQVPALLLAGALPRSTKKLEPGSGTPFRLTPHGDRLAWMAAKILEFTLSLAYRYLSVTPCGKPAAFRVDLHFAMSPLPLLSGYRL